MSGTDGRQARWAQHKSERRALVVASALAVIEEQAPGAEVHVQQIAERAGMARPVVYRHFADRADLDRAVRTRILEDVSERILSSVSLEGTVIGIISRIVHSYVDWAGQHQALHVFALHEDGQGSVSVAEHMVQPVVDGVRDLIVSAADGLGLELSADDSAALDLLVLGLVGQGVAVVRHWLRRPVLEPTAVVLSRMVADTVWYQIDGHARARGLVLDPDQRIEDLLAAAAEGSGS